MDDIEQVQARIRYAFGDVKLLNEALTHSSYANESPGRGQSNERLEFLGDAVLELSITEELYVRYPEANEGQLTTFRAMLVNEGVLAGLSRKLKIDRVLLLGHGEENQGGRQRQSLLSDAFEALLGAIFLDGGYAVAKQWALERFVGLWPRQMELPVEKDHKTKLQELTQQHCRDRPVYVLEGSSGPEHERTFHILLKLPTGEEFRDSGSSVKKAEQNAARQAMVFLKQGDPVS
ncbi:ribonuclease III [Desulfonatronum lacustre]|uniref:ribonuclease III n=1 Tax=Desulfonatronum lacustre TaxID=66849 RepID=UPI00048EBC86|nr:ribonuclease III [Desulfonatronum lacustre]